MSFFPPLLNIAIGCALLVHGYYFGVPPIAAPAFLLVGGFQLGQRRHS